jgi:hypothetical protein
LELDGWEIGLVHELRFQAAASCEVRPHQSTRWRDTVVWCQPIAIGRSRKTANADEKMSAMSVPRLDGARAGRRPALLLTVRVPTVTVPASHRTAAGPMTCMRPL